MQGKSSAKEEDVENGHNDLPTILKLIYTFTELKSEKKKNLNDHLPNLSVFIISLWESSRETSKLKLI